MFKKSWRIISIILLLILLASMFLFPAYAGPLSITLLTLSIGSAVVFTVHKHWGIFKSGESTGGQMLRNTSLDLLGLALTMGAAIYFGRLAGGYFGLRSGIWVGLLAGFVGGFGAAWAVRSVWGRVSGLGA